MLEITAYLTAQALPGLSSVIIQSEPQGNGLQVRQSSTAEASCMEPEDQAALPTSNLVFAQPLEELDASDTEAEKVSAR